MIAPEVTEAIERVIGKHMAPYGMRGVKVREGEDHDGDPVLFVDVEYGGIVDQPLPLRITSDLLGEVCDELERLNEGRFPHISHHFHDRQTVSGSP